ncbi:hypothetical protein VIGAN_04268000, partial [Vigna angularis var. angularis]
FSPLSGNRSRSLPHRTSHLQSPTVKIAFLPLPPTTTHRTLPLPFSPLLKSLAFFFLFLTQPLICTLPLSKSHFSLFLPQLRTLPLQLSHRHFVSVAITHCRRRSLSAVTLQFSRV